MPGAVALVRRFSAYAYSLFPIPYSFTAPVMPDT